MQNTKVRIEPIEDLLIFFFFILSLDVFFYHSFVYFYIYIVAIAITVSFIAYFYIRLTKPKASRALTALFAINAICFFSIFLLSKNTIFLTVVGAIDTIMSFALFLLLLLPIFFMVTLAIYFAHRRNKRPAVLLLALSLILLLTYFTLHLIFKEYTLDDEMLIVVESSKLIIHGINPYGVSFTNVLYENRSIGLSTSTTNQILSTLQYPPLFVLSFIPFYLIQPTFTGITATDFTTEAVVYLFILILVVAFAQYKKQSIAPNMVLILATVFVILNIASTTDFLIIALLLLAYMFIEKKYAWLFLGLCLAMQELLWLPVILMLAYLANEKGIKTGIYNTLLAVAVFLVISAPFIIAKPLVFFKSILLPLSKPLPSGVPVLGFMLLRSYPILMNTYPIIFGVAIIIGILILLYEGKKELIGFFSILPFLFLSHSIVNYFSLFSFLMLFGLYSKSNKSNSKAKGKGIITKYLHKHKKVTCIAILLLILFAAVLIVYSHALFEKGFNIRISNETLTNIDGQGILDMHITYNNLSNSTLFIYLITAYPKSIGLLGLFNQTMLVNTTANCTSTDYTCLTNTNVLKLKGSGTYEVLAKTYENATGQCAVPILYNGEYYYISNSVCT